MSEIDGPADGTYYLRPLGRRLLNNDENEWGNWTCMVNGNTVQMMVSGGKVTLIQSDDKPHLSLVGNLMFWNQPMLIAVNSLVFS